MHVGKVVGVAQKQYLPGHQMGVADNFLGVEDAEAARRVVNHLQGVAASGQNFGEGRAGGLCNGYYKRRDRVGVVDDARVDWEECAELADFAFCVAGGEGGGSERDVACC